jgi:maltose O-acetyltransferase
MSLLRRVCGRFGEISAWWRREIAEWFRALLRAIPGETGCWIRNKLYGYAAGRGVRVLSQVIVYYPKRLTLGAHVGIAAYCQINAAGGVEIGDDVLIGPGTMIWSQGHIYASLDSPIRCQGYSREKVVVENDVWIGAGAIILPGVRVAQGTVVAAGAVVTKSTEPFTVMAGVPAQMIARRGEEANASPGALTPHSPAPRQKLSEA